MSHELLRVENLKQYYAARGASSGKKAMVRAVDGASISVCEGEVLGVVGESGCGKSTLGKTICKLLEPTGGKIIFEGEDITDFGTRQMRRIRQKIQMVFQDPYSSLDPRMTVRDIIAEPLVANNICRDRRDIDERVIGLMREVGLDDYHARRYPHEFSGGQRQRIGIARAMALKPKLIIADEPVSALDVSIQAQVLNLLKRLKTEHHLTYLFISHDLSVVEHISDRVAVMYLGNFVEVGKKEDLYSRPLHPYTQALLDAVPVMDPDDRRERTLLEGTIPSAMNPPEGCKFHTRCPRCMERCRREIPEKTEVSEGHYVYCHLYGN